MTTKFVQPGEVMDYAASSAIAAGDVVVAGARVGVALCAIPSGSSGSVQVSGVFTLAKKSTDNIAQGAVVYWDATHGYITSTSTDNTLAGYAFAAAGASTTTINVKLNN